MISKLCLPICIRRVRSFLCHVGFYRQFIKDFSMIAFPWCKLLKKDAKFNLMVIV